MKNDQLSSEQNGGVSREASSGTGGGFMGCLFNSVPKQVVAFEVCYVSERDYCGVPFLGMKGGFEIDVELVRDGGSAVEGDFIIFLSFNDIYRCPRDVFLAKYQPAGEVSQ